MNHSMDREVEQVGRGALVLTVALLIVGAEIVLGMALGLCWVLAHWIAK